MILFTRIGPDLSDWISGHRLAEIGTVLVFVSLFTQGLIRIKFLGFSTTSWDYVAVFLGPILLAITLRNTEWRRVIPYRERILILGYLGLIGISVIRSPVTGDSYSILLMNVRNLVLASWVCYGVTVLGFQRVAIIATITLGFVSSFAFTLYGSFVLLDESVLHDRRPYGYLILLVDEYRVPRLTGLSGDPNFYSTAVILVVGFSLYLMTSSSRLYKFAAVWALIISSMTLVLTLSRTGILVLTVVFLVWTVALLATQSNVRIWIKTSRARLLSALLLVLISASLFSPVLPGRNENISVYDLSTQRYKRVLDSPRFEQWSSVINFTGFIEREGEESFELTSFFRIDNLLFGRGLRTNQIVINSYSHNSYLDLIFESGLVITVVWCLLWWLGVKRFWRGHGNLMSKSAILLSSFGLGLMMMTVSIIHQPFWWIMWAVIVAGSAKLVDRTTDDSETTARVSGRQS